MNDPASSSPTHDAGLAGRLRAELRAYAIVSVYLYVCFAALLLYKTALLQEAGVHYTPLGVAALKALVVAKFLLIGDAIRRAAQRQSSRRLPVRIVTRLLWLLVILVLLTTLEELIIAAWQGQSVADALAVLRSLPSMETLAELLLMLLVLTPLVAVTEVNQALGPGTLTGLLSRSREDAGDTRTQGSPTDGERR